MVMLEGMVVVSIISLFASTVVLLDVFSLAPNGPLVTVIWVTRLLSLVVTFFSSADGTASVPIGKQDKLIKMMKAQAKCKTNIFHLPLVSLKQNCWWLAKGYSSFHERL